MLHLDIKRLVRIQRPSHRVTGDRRDGVKGIGAEFLHIAIDDHSRIAFTAMYPDQTEPSSTHFLTAAVAWFQRLGIRIRKLLTDNGLCYKAHRFAHACRQLQLTRRRTKPIEEQSPSKNKALHAPHQRQGRALHQNRYQRMGLRLHLPELRRPSRFTAGLDPPIQLAQTSRQPKPTSTHLKIRNR
jgi:hypothetical protein